MHPRAAVGAEPGYCVDATDFSHNASLLTTGLRFASLERLVEGSPRHPEDAALRFDRPDRAMLLNEPDSQLLSLAKKAVAFFKMSRSILS